MPLLVWLLEDQKPMLLLLQRHLERSGFAVRGFLSAEEAEAAFEGLDVPDLVIADQTLPGKSGVEFAKDVLHRYPRSRCLLCSGYPVDLAVLPEALRTRAAFLQKPFLPGALVEAMAALLGDFSEPSAAS